MGYFNQPTTRKMGLYIGARSHSQHQGPVMALTGPANRGLPGGPGSDPVVTLTPQIVRPMWVLSRPICPRPKRPSSVSRALVGSGPLAIGDVGSNPSNLVSHWWRGV